jgi:uridine kinase
MVDTAVFIAGPSGSGKSTLARASELPTLVLDNFYRPYSDELPRRFGSVDWESIESYDLERAVKATVDLLTLGKVEVPRYDLSTDSSNGVDVLAVNESKRAIVEGIFSLEVLHCARPRLPPDLRVEAFVIVGSKFTFMIDRVRRDLAERRMPFRRIVFRSLRLLLTDQTRLQLPGVTPVTRREMSQRLSRA